MRVSRASSATRASTSSRAAVCSLPRKAGEGGVGVSQVAAQLFARLWRAPPSQPSPASGGRGEKQKLAAFGSLLRNAGKSSSAAAHAALEAGRVAAHRQLELADRGDPLLGQAVGGLVGGNAVAFGDLED